MSSVWLTPSSLSSMVSVKQAKSRFMRYEPEDSPLAQRRALRADRMDPPDSWPSRWPR